MNIPVIDIFAGPGGLGEGFSSVFKNDKRVFKTVLSIEKDNYAHKTLELRSFFRKFHPDNVPADYYNHIKKENKVTIEELYDKWPDQAKAAKKEAWQAKLGYDEKSEEPEEVDRRIRKALNNAKDWILIGGPPCQAYSLLGRAARKQKVLDASTDERVDLYKQYLRILAVHNPSVFIMENVKGMLSAKTRKNNVFQKVLTDLKDPIKFTDDISIEAKKNLNCPGYNIYSLIKSAEEYDSAGHPFFAPRDFVIRCEDYGIPQTRHRVILLGIRKNIDYKPNILKKESEVPLSHVIDDLPKIRSGLSRVEDNYANWYRNVYGITANGAMEGMSEKVKKEIIKTTEKLTKTQNGTGNEYVRYHANSKSEPYRAEWFLDKNLDGISNHTSKSHMGSDLHRYLFASSFAKVYSRSPKLKDFPAELLPNHHNVGLKTKKFVDRFRVQLPEVAAKTITSHISKDGHYYIHYDSKQCRSLTVREAARIQTFPDNYFFCGPRTSQYIQVGNAVPPLLARKISKIVLKIMITTVM